MQPERENQPTFFELAVAQRGGATYGKGGRPACRVGVLLRVLILRQLYGLNPQAEEQLCDRSSFQKFAQLGDHEAVPDGGWYDVGVRCLESPLPIFKCMTRSTASRRFS